MAKTAAAKVVKQDLPFYVDYDYETSGKLILRVTGVIRGNGGEIEYKNLSLPGAPLKRVPRAVFNDIVAKVLGFKGSEKKG